ncbi:MAG: FtsQ-type POTRA domain-containing protein [Chloroflexi bacterium]|nr:FtsQ-type POTRA domain-containing protein [Chloroflexota bacterium]
MTSVDKRRRERIRAKQAARYVANSQSPLDEVGDFESEAISRSRTTTAPPDGHVLKAPGRNARRRRLEVRREARTQGQEVRAINEAKPPQPSRMFFSVGAKAASKPASLSKRRSARQREHLRRQGLDPARPEARVRPQGVVWVSWRWFSGALTLVLIFVLYAMVGTDVFVVNSVAVGGEKYLTAEQIFEASGVANRHLFWVNPLEVEQRLESNPSIADAQVYVGWPPNMVSILISEREPALVWEQGNFRVWVDVNGIVMFQREERPELLRIVSHQQDAEPLGVGSTIDREVIAGALQLKAKFPTIEELLYDPVKGLGYQDGRNWIVWFGIGTNMEMKVRVYDAIVAAYAIQFLEVDVSDPDHPSFTERFPTDQ